MSVSSGLQGARISANTKGQVRRTFGIPGLGIYDTKKIADLNAPNEHQKEGASSLDPDIDPKGSVLEVSVEGGLVEIPEGTNFVHIQSKESTTSTAKVWMAIAIVATILFLFALLT